MFGDTERKAGNRNVSFVRTGEMGSFSTVLHTSFAIAFVLFGRSFWRFPSFAGFFVALVFCTRRRFLSELKTSTLRSLFKVKTGEKEREKKRQICYVFHLHVFRVPCHAVPCLFCAGKPCVALLESTRLRFSMATQFAILCIVKEGEELAMQSIATEDAGVSTRIHLRQHHQATKNGSKRPKPNTTFLLGERTSLGPEYWVWVKRDWTSKSGQT